ncbi:hypothetical protein FJZ19_05490 [Candidatus Pacearchaeota archaeon]|nr:hypothetical protein [Candidatus Pacearchaeota archaeon]
MINELNMFNYTLLAVLNIYQSRESHLSKIEKTAIISTTLLGLDSIVTPVLSGGRSVHELLGFAASSNETNAFINQIESLPAWLGLVYHAGKNLYCEIRRYQKVKRNQTCIQI